MNYIKKVPGNVIGKGDSKTDILTLLGLEVSPLDNKNDGRGGDVISSVVIGDKQYALSDVLTALASAMGGGSFVPDITNPQDGDTLVYDATAEKWVNGSGGGGSTMMVINVTADDSGGETVYSADKTTAEIMAAINAGQYCIVRYDNEYFPFMNYFENSDIVVFGQTEINDGSVVYNAFQFFSDNFIFKIEETYPST